MEKKEISIDVRDMFRKIFGKWKLLILALVIGMALGACYDLVRSMRTKAPETVNQDLNVKTTPYDKFQENAKLRSYITNYNTAKYYESYLNNSVLMNADPSKMYTLYLVYQIETDNTKDGFLFHDLAMDDKALDKAGENTGIKKEYISELININDAKSVDFLDKKSKDDKEVVQEKDNNGKIIFEIPVTITGTDKDQCLKLADAVYDLFNRTKKKAESTNTVLTKVSEYGREYVDTNLDSTKSTAYQTFQAAVTASSDSYERLSDLEKEEAAKIIDGKSTMEESVSKILSSYGIVTDNTAVERQTKISIDIKHLIAGALILFLFFIVLEVLIYINDKHVKTDDELSNSWNINKLGSSHDEETMKNSLNSLAALLHKENFKSIFIADEVESEESRKFYDSLLKILPDLKITMSKINAEGSDISGLAEAESVILFSKAGKTERKEVNAVKLACGMSQTILTGYVAF